MAIVNEVVTRFSYKGSVQKLNQYNKQLGVAIKGLAAFGAAVGAAAAGFAVFVNSTASAIDPMIQLARTTGVSIEKIQELGYAASQTGSDVEAVQSSITNLSKKIGEAAQKGSEDFMRLGISVRDMNGEVKSADAILLELSNRFRQLNLSSSEQQDFAERLGVDKSLVQLLRLSGNELEGLTADARSYGIVTTEQANKLAAYNDSVTRVRFAFQALRNQVAIGATPALQKLADTFSQFLKDNRNSIANLIENIGNALGATIKMFARLSSAVLKAWDALGQFKTLIGSIGLAIGIIVTPVTSAIAGILLVLDDLIVGINGGKSAIFEFVNAINVAMDNVALAIWEGIAGAFKSAFEWVKNALSNFTNYISDAFKNVFGKVKGFFGASGTDNSLNLQAANLPVFNTPSNSNINNNNVSQDVSINIAGGDPQATANAVRDTLQLQLNDAQNQFNVGGI